jgi:hypothetical protein
MTKMSVKTKGKDSLASWREVMKSAPSLVDEMCEMVAEEALDLLKEGYSKETDPYGQKWQEKKVDDGRAILVGKSVQLKKWGIIKKGNGKWTLAPSPTAGAYAGAHQDPRPRALWGGKKLPQRMMIPSKARGLPPAWAKRMEEAMSDVFDAHFGGGSSSKNLGFMRYKIIGLKRRFSLPAILKRAINEAVDG